MSTKVIKRDDASWLLSATMPSDWGTVSAGTVSVTNLSGTLLVTAQAVTILAPDTSSAAVEPGDETITATTGGAGAFDNGDPIRVGSDAEGWQHTIVESYNSSTKVITIQDFFEHNFASGAAIESRVMTYDLDTDTSTAWDDIGEVTVEWAPTSDDMPFRETWAVLDTKSSSSDLENKFNVQFRRYYDEIQSEHFNDYYTRARARVKLVFETRERDINKLVDNELLDELYMLQIAIIICLSKGNEFDDELAKLNADFKEQLALIDQINVWIDTNEDDIQTEDEYQPASLTGFTRGM